MNNFITDFDLHCTPKVRIGLMGSSLFVGFFIGAMIFPRLADIYGRRPIFRIFYLLHVLGIAIMLYAPNLYYMYVGIMCVGLASPVRTAVGFVLCLEFMETKY